MFFSLGILVIKELQPTGLGGSLNVTFVCNSCCFRNLKFEGSAHVEGSKRTVVALALGVAFLITGHSVWELVAFQRIGTMK